MRAAHEGDLKRLQKAVAKGGDINEVIYWSNSNDATPLSGAVLHNRIKNVKYLLEQGADPNINKNPSVLAWAVANSNQDMILLLLKAGADPNIIAPYGRGPLHEAIMQGWTPGVKLLLKHGAQIDDNAIQLAREKGFASISKLLEPGVATVRRPVETALPAPRQAGLRSSAQVLAPNYKSAERSNDFAVVVGIEKYSALPDAPFAKNDADVFVSHLEALGVPRRNIKSITGPNASLSALGKNLEAWLPRNVKSDSRVFFYFSGHGAPDTASGEAYLLPWDGDANYLINTAYPLKKLYAQLNSLKAKEIIVILDACFSGAGGRSVLAKGARPLVTTVNMGSTKAGRLSILTASQANQITATLDNAEHGAFTYYLLRGLNGDGTIKSGQITLRGLFDYILPNVQDEASRQNREQTPTLHAESDLTIR